MFSIFFLCQIWSTSLGWLVCTSTANRKSRTCHSYKTPEYILTFFCRKNVMQHTSFKVCRFWRNAAMWLPNKYCVLLISIGKVYIELTQTVRLFHLNQHKVKHIHLTDLLMIDVHSLNAKRPSHQVLPTPTPALYQAPPILIAQSLIHWSKFRLSMIDIFAMALMCRCCFTPSR